MSVVLTPNCLQHVCNVQWRFCFQVAMNRAVTLSSTISAKVTKLPYIGKPDNKLARIKSHEVFTQAIPRDVTVKPDIIPLWHIVLAAVAGTAILLLLVYLLYKVITVKNLICQCLIWHLIIKTGISLWFLQPTIFSV